MDPTLPGELAAELTARLQVPEFAPMKSANAATLALYEALNDEQKKKADELILGMGMM